MNSIQQNMSNEKDQDTLSQSDARGGGHRRYRTPPNYQPFADRGGRGGIAQRRFSPEEVNQQQLHYQTNLSRLEYSTIIHDDTERDDSSGNATQIRKPLSLDQTDIEGGKSSSVMDTSRFGDNYFKNLDGRNPQNLSQISGYSNVSLLIDPKEHLRQLKSPIRDRLINYFAKGLDTSKSQFSPTS